MLAIIFFSIFFGIALLSVVKESKELVTLIDQINAVIMRMVNMVMHFAPIAVFCLVGRAIADLGIDLLAQLLGYVAVLLFVLIFPRAGNANAVSQGAYRLECRHVP